VPYLAALLRALGTARAGGAVRALVARDPARHADLNDPQAIARLVAELAVAGDVQAVRYARARGVRIAPQGTGHGAAPLEPLDGAMLLRTTRMRKVRIDPAARTARAEAGAVWQDVTVPAGQHGLAGSSPNVGVTGYTLGGGLGWLARRYGLAANSVTAAELVTPGGDLVRADAGHEPDLFWAVRGGGGVGVVTALEMRLYPVRELCAGGSSAWTGTCVNSEKRARAPLPRIGRSVVGREIRIGLMLTAAACLVAVLVDWAVKELSSEATQAGIEAEQASVEAEQASVEAEQASVEAEQAIVEAEQAIVEAGQEDTGRAQDATAESHDQGVR
jgi:hypothetical protein